MSAGTSPANGIVLLLKRKTKLLVSMVRRPWITTARLIGDLEALDIRPGGVLLVHAALRSIGFVPGGAATVISALQSVVGPSGTLVMPSHTWEWVEEHDLREFDVQKTPCCVGTIPELFRRMPGVVRSLHPTHSVAARGCKASWLIDGHENALTPCGNGTPYPRIIDCNGQILFLGCRLNSNTMFHGLEAMAAVPYLMQDHDDMIEMIDAHGMRRTRAVRRHRAGIKARYLEMEPLLADCGALRSGTVGEAGCLIVESRRMRDVLLPLLQRDPLFLLASTYNGA